MISWSAGSGGLIHHKMEDKFSGSCFIYIQFYLETDLIDILTCLWESKTVRKRQFCPLIQIYLIQFHSRRFYCLAFINTVKWSNFDRWDPKMGVFLQSTEATPCGHLQKWKLTPKNSPADTTFMAAMAMALPWKLVEDFQSFLKNTKLWLSR